MAHPDDTTGNGPRRAKRIKRRRYWQLRLLLVLVAMLVVTGTAFAYTGVLRSDDTSRRAAARGTTASPPPTAGDIAACRSPLGPTAPLRLWIGGDSLAGSLGPSLGDLTGKTGVVQPVFNSRVSSGLASPEFYDWPKHAAEDMFTYNPEVAVFIIGANDAKPLPSQPGIDPQWRAQYSALVEKMMTVLVAARRSVFWVGAPVMKEDGYSAKVQVVNEVFQEVARRHREVTYVDSYRTFSTADGKFAPSMPGVDGKPVRVRADDGVHLTPEGGDRLATAVFDKLDPLCRITQQAIPGAPKPTIEVHGSSQLPGTRRQGTTVTTEAAPSTTRAPATTRPEPTAPPTTAPPATSPPTTSPPTTSELCHPVCT